MGNARWNARWNAKWGHWSLIAPCESEMGTLLINSSIRCQSKKRGSGVPPRLSLGILDASAQASAGDFVPTPASSAPTWPRRRLIYSAVSRAMCSAASLMDAADECLLRECQMGTLLINWRAKWGHCSLICVVDELGRSRLRESMYVDSPDERRRFHSDFTPAPLFPAIPASACNHTFACPSRSADGIGIFRHGLPVV